MKFADNLAKNLYETMLDGFSDDSQGNMAENGVEYYLFTEFDIGETDLIHAILSEDDEGSVFVDVFPTKQAAEHAWDEQYQALEQDAEPLTLEEDDDDV